MQELVLEQYSKRRDTYGSIPWAMAFCYPKTGPICIKGLTDVVHEAVKGLGPCHYRMTWWQEGVSRGIWLINHPKMTLTRNVENGRDIHRLTKFDATGCLWIKKLRRVPGHYLVEFDESTEAI